jgi:hypothetical protein
MQLSAACIFVCKRSSLVLMNIPFCPVLPLGGFAPVLLQICEHNESPLLLLLDPAIDHSRKDLPLDVYETGGACARKAGGVHQQPLHISCH